MTQNKTVGLDSAGRCCGRKPIAYKAKWHPEGPHRFCPRCDRSYNLNSPDQLQNWAWKSVNGVWERKSLV